MFLPICLNLKNKKILIIGGGSVAAHKLLTLKKYTAAITLLALEIQPVLQKTKYKKIIKSYEPCDLSGYALIYACTNDRRTNQRIVRDARSQNILVNVCDEPSASNFISPAIFKRGFMSVAVSSDGRDVRQSLQWREKIRSIL
jgi:precorrin-2 dehydrogenase/sirohydrochlorin ferrochelatase